mmetsp:Transcript_2395/g.6602  ORF Transcript_2395/g.6602 Transcript_2395/m.6602 type:complete len:307 (+) Transcript_2395:1053-1973(+)
MVRSWTLLSGMMWTRLRSWPGSRSGLAVASVSVTMKYSLPPATTSRARWYDPKSGWMWKSLATTPFTLFGSRPMAFVFCLHSSKLNSTWPAHARRLLNFCCSESSAASPSRTAPTSFAWPSGSNLSFCSSERRSVMWASMAAFSFSSRFPSVLLLDMFCSMEAMRSLRFAMPRDRFFCSESRVCSLVCVSRSCSRSDLSSPSPSGTGCAAMPAVSADICHWAFSMSFLKLFCWSMRASHFSFSFWYTFSFDSICLRSSPRAPCACLRASCCVCRSDSRFFSFDSLDTTSFDSFECSSSSFFSSLER